MRIAILAWGSLIREPRGLPIAGEWQKDGPALQLEFSRISKSGIRRDCLTLVIDEDSVEESQTLWAISPRTSLPRSIADLQEREGTIPGNIGFCDVAAGRFAPNAIARHSKSCERIYKWANDRCFDAVVWTALGRRFEEVLDTPFSPASALQYLNSLPSTIKEKALEYIRSAPEQTMTPFRRFCLQHYGIGRREH